jgi:HSP20 family protein
MNIGDLIPRSRRQTALATRRPADPFTALQNQIDRLFEDFSNGFGLARHDGFFGTWPSIEVREDDKKYYVEAELPGMDEKDVEVTLLDNLLTIRGERREEKSDARQQWSERYFGSFERRIRLDAEVDPDNVSATFKKGVLKIEIAKAPEVQQRARRIPVKS